VQFMEMKQSGIKFVRIDADLSENLKDDSSKDDEKSLKEIRESLEKMFKDNLGNDKLKIQVENLKTETVPGMILLSEHSRRMQEMSKMFGGLDTGMFPSEETLVLNNKNSLIKALVSMKDKQDKAEDIKLICQHIYDLAMLSHKQLEPENMTKFIERSNLILEKLAGKLGA